MLAFSFGFVGGTLTLTQSADDGAMTIDNSGAGDAFRTNDGSGLVTYVAATNLVVNLLDGTSNQFDLDLDNAHTGDIELNLGEGIRNVNFTGTSNAMDGNLTVTSGAGTQVVEVGVNSGLTVGGNLLIDLGTDVDAVDEDNSNIAVTGDFSFVGVNFFENGGTMTVGGNATVDTTNEVEDSLFDDDATMAIAGDFTFTGGDGRDEVTMNGVAAGTSVGGNALIDVGDNTTGGVQFLFFNLPNSSVGGTLTAISTSATNLDSFATHPSGSFGGDISVDLGEGPNDAVFAGTFGGTDIQYTGGGDIDNVTFGTTGTPANVDIQLGAGDDNLALLAGAAISPTTLTVDFGGGVDSFVNGFGQFNFNAAFYNWDNFNRFYTASTDQWNMRQLVDNGDVTVDNNGIGNAIQLTGAYTTSMSPAASVRMNLMSLSSSNLAVDMGSPLAGNLILDINNGARDVDFIGTSNSFGGFIMISGADDVQNVDLAVNNALTVTDSVVVQLGEGYDIVDDDGNDINITDTLIFRGVNEFENEGTVNLGAMTMNTSFEVENARIDNDGSFNVANNMVYIGGDGKDEIIFNDGVSIQGYTSLDVGENTGPELVQTVNLGGGFFAGKNLYVFGGDSMGGNSVVTDFTTVMLGAVIVDFSTTTTDNSVLLDGGYGGNFGFYRGGSGQDVVSLYLTGGDMDLHMQMGAGADTLNLDAGSYFNLLLVNFGDGEDTFNDAFFGTYPFATLFGNLP